MDIPRILLAGTSSRAGKTTLSMGLMRALRDRGLKVQPFKTGPDFIDPSYHHLATGQPSRNLDGFMMTPGDILETFQRNSRGADIAVVEGAMGLYDSHNALEEKGSSAEISKIIQAPVALIANAERMSRTAAPFVLGYKLFDRDVDIRGVILNRMGSKRHRDKARLAVEKLAGMEVLGTVPRRPEVKVPERHLGLVPAYERERLDALFDDLAALVEEFMDVDRIIEIAEAAGEMEDVEINPIFQPKDETGAKIGILRDECFTFYYQDSLDALRARGAELVTINAIEDKRLPEVNALYIGGGFPEVFAEQLEKNVSLREAIRTFCEEGRPVYGECGGLMYLGEEIVTKEGATHEMVGYLPIRTRMQERFQALGYVITDVAKDTFLYPKGARLVGHEFHHSKVEALGKLDFAYKNERGTGIEGAKDGIIKQNTLASYLHVHVLSYPKMAERFVRAAGEGLFVP
jgi:cobyrinic acid a,c-diamide synthase